MGQGVDDLPIQPEERREALKSLLCRLWPCGAKAPRAIERIQLMCPRLFADKVEWCFFKKILSRVPLFHTFFPFFV